MFRSRAPRAVIAALTAVVLIVGLMASTTSAAPKPKPTPTPTPSPSPTPIPSPTPTPIPTPEEGNRIVYFGDPASDPNGDGVLDPTTVTAGGVFRVDVIARNDGGQNLSHAMLAIGDLAAAWAGAPASLPDGAQLVDVEVMHNGLAQDCDFVAPADGFSCEFGNFRSGDEIEASFWIETASDPDADTAVWASFKVAENVPDQGANSNTFFAFAPLAIAQTTSDANSTYKLDDEFLTLSTDVTGAPASDKQKTILNVPNGVGGIISIFEADNPTGCTPACIGQEVLANVRDGAELDPYLVWELRIVGIGAGKNQGGIYHESIAAPGTFDQFVYSNATVCDGPTDVNCFETYEVSRNANSTKIIFRTETNGKVRAN